MCRFCGAEVSIPSAVLTEIHSLQRRLHHLEIDNQSLSLHNSSYQEELAKLRHQHEIQMAQSIAFANKQTELKCQQQLQLAAYLGTDDLISNLHTENGAITRELKALKHKVDGLEATKQELRDELNYTKSVIALYQYPKTSTLHQMAAYKRPGTTPNSCKLHRLWNQKTGNDTVSAFDAEFQQKVNSTTIATYTMNPKATTALLKHRKHERKRKRSRSNVI